MTALLLAASPAVAAETIPVTIVSGERTIPLTLELATTPQQRETGLMHRTTLAPNDGMLFEFPQPKNYTFWMKNTPLSLDILFINAAHIVVEVAPNTTPYALDPIASGQPITTVIELNGGRAAKEGIRFGDKVVYAIPQHIPVE